MEARINFLGFQELKIGETFIIIYTGDRSEREKLSRRKEVHIKTAEAHRDDDLSSGANAIDLTDGTGTHVAYNTPVIRVII